MNKLYDELASLLDSPSRDQSRERIPAPSGRVWSFCPCHPDGTKHGRRTLSLHPIYGVDCFAGCAFRDIVRALRERAGIHPAHVAPTTPYRNGNHKARTGGRVVAAWVYADEEGHPLFRVVRKQWPDGAKSFLQQHPVGSCAAHTGDPCKHADSGWRWGRGGARYELYRRPELALTPLDEMVFLTEGEACADAIVHLGLTATTSPGGAGKWGQGAGEYEDALRDRRVIILPDNDQPGRDHAENIVASLLGVAAEARVVILPGLPNKGDVVDWLGAGGTRGELLTLAGARERAILDAVLR